MDNLFRAGAFQGEKASDAYFVRCARGDTMTQDDIDRGQVIVVVGFAPLKRPSSSSSYPAKDSTVREISVPAPLFPAMRIVSIPTGRNKFQVVIDEQPVAGLKKMGALKKKTEPIKWRTAGDPSHERVLPAAPATSRSCSSKG